MREKPLQQFYKEAKISIEKDGAEAIVLGCTGMSSLSKKLEQELRLPVIDPAVASLKLAEVYVSMGLTSSNISYEVSSEKEIF